MRTGIVVVPTIGLNRYLIHCLGVWPKKCSTVHCGVQSSTLYLDYNRETYDSVITRDRSSPSYA